MPILKKLTTRTRKPASNNPLNFSKIFSLWSLLIIIVAAIVYINLYRSPDYNPAAWQKLIREHFKQYPAMQPADVYKLVYQGTFGPGHLGADSTKMLAYLQNEIANVAADSDAVFYERVSPSKYIRVNLKYLKFKHVDPGPLVKAILKSSTVPADSSLFLQHWKLVEQMVADGELPFDPTDFQAFSDSIKSNGYPVIHHSEQYMKIYQPAYRVIDEKFLDSLPVKIEKTLGK